MIYRDFFTSPSDPFLQAFSQSRWQTSTELKSARPCLTDDLQSVKDVRATELETSFLLNLEVSSGHKAPALAAKITRMLANCLAQMIYEVQVLWLSCHFFNDISHTCCPLKSLPAPP